MRIKYFIIGFSCSLLCMSAWAQSVTIKNNLPASPVCLDGGNAVNVFITPSNQKVIQPGHSVEIQGDFSKMPGFGIQVNNWYWIDRTTPPSTSGPQNPDNSGAQFTLSNTCILGEGKAVFGKGVPTYTIADVTAQQATGPGACLVTISANAHTNNDVTLGCCSPPGVGGGPCTKR